MDIRILTNDLVNELRDAAELPSIYDAEDVVNWVAYEYLKMKEAENSEIPEELEIY